MNPLALVTWLGVACAVVVLCAGIAAFTLDRRSRRPEAEQRTARQGPATLADLEVDLAEQRRALDELRDEVEQLRRQPG